MKDKLFPLECALLPNNNFKRESVLFTDHAGLLVYQPQKTNVGWTDCAYKNLYITSELEIKVGTIVLHERGWVGKVRAEKYNDAPEVEVDWFYSEDRTAHPRTSLIYIKKIEFTTDDYLIGIGVPAIDENVRAVVKCIVCKGNGTWEEYEVGVVTCSKCMGKPIEVNFLSEFVKRYNQKDNQKGKKSWKYVEGVGRVYCKKDNQKGVDVDKLALEKYPIDFKPFGSHFGKMANPKLASLDWDINAEKREGYRQALQSNSGVRLGEGFVKKVLVRYTKEEISFGKMVELFNEQIHFNSGGNHLCENCKAPISVTSEYRCNNCHTDTITDFPILKSNAGFSSEKNIIEFLQKRKSEYHKTCLKDEFVNGRFWEAQETIEHIQSLTKEQSEEESRFPETIEEVKEYERTGILPKVEIRIECEVEDKGGFGLGDIEDNMKWHSDYRIKLDNNGQPVIRFR